MILSDIDIAKELKKRDASLRIIPCEDSQIQPCSVDLHLSHELKTLHDKTIDLRNGSYKLKPMEFILGSTVEYVEIPSYLCGQLEGRSSVARKGLMCHITAGFIDAGYRGNITLELFNASDKEFELVDGASICQLVLHSLTSKCLRKYGSSELGSKYQDSEGTVRSKL